MHRSIGKTVAAASQKALLLSVLALLALFYLYPTITQLRIDAGPFSAMISDIFPAGEINDSEDLRFKRILPYRQHHRDMTFGLGEGHERRESSPQSTPQNNTFPGSSEIYYIGEYRRTKSCVNFFDELHFWYPHCPDTISTWERYLTDHWDQISPTYRQHWWQMPVGDVEGIERRSPSNQISEPNFRRDETRVLVSPSPPSRPNRPDLLKPPVSARPDTAGYVGFYGPFSRPERISSGLPGGFNYICPPSGNDGAYCEGEFGYAAIVYCQNGWGWESSCGSSIHSSAPSPRLCWETLLTIGNAECIDNPIYPEQSKSPLSNRLNVPDGFIGNHGPVALDPPGCNALEVRSHPLAVARVVESKESVTKTTLSKVPKSTSQPPSIHTPNHVDNAKRSVLPYNMTSKTWTCPASNYNGNFCSMGVGAPGIIRCSNGVGIGGNCNNNMMGNPPRGNHFSPCWESSPFSGNAACSKNCIVYAEDWRGPFPRPHCTPMPISAVHEAAANADGLNDRDPDLEAISVASDKPGSIQSPSNSQSGRRSVDVEASESNPEMVPHIYPPYWLDPQNKPKPKPKQPPPGKQPTALETEEHLRNHPIVMKNLICVLELLRTKSASMQPHTTVEEHLAKKDSRSVPCTESRKMFGFCNDKRPFNAVSETFVGRIESLELNPEMAQHSVEAVDEVVSKRETDDTAHPPFQTISAGRPDNKQPSLSGRMAPFQYLQIENVDKDCRGKTGPDLEACSKRVSTKNSRLLSIALVLGIIGILLLSLIIVDKVRRRSSSRRSSVPLFSKGKSPTGQMSHPRTSQYISPTMTMDGANDGWTNWIIGKQEASGQASLSPRSNAPRIPSLTLPKPSLATVRKFSGLGPDMESIREERRGIKGKWKSDSKLKWNTTV